jgi:competence protein ComFB
MQIHNIMEDFIYQKANEIFEDERNSGKSTFCTCPQCLLDVCCYVLNQIQPVYIYSSRGAAYFRLDYLENLQREVDLVTQIHAGIAKIAKTKRPFCSTPEQPENYTLNEFFYHNFPTITGKLFNSVSFEPLFDLEISLLFNGEPMQMINANWENPYKIFLNTRSIFSFLPHPLKAEKEGVLKSFEFELVVDNPAYEPFKHYFQLELTSTREFINFYRINKTHDIGELYLIPVDKE